MISDNLLYVYVRRIKSSDYGVNKWIDKKKTVKNDTKPNNHPASIDQCGGIFFWGKKLRYLFVVASIQYQW